MKKTNLGLPIWQAGDVTNWSATNEGFENLDLELEKLKDDIDGVAEEGIDWNSFSHFYPPSTLTLAPILVDKTQWNQEKFKGLISIFGLNWGTEIEKMPDSLNNENQNLIAFFNFTIENLTQTRRDDGSYVFTISDLLNPHIFFALISKIINNYGEFAFYGRGRNYPASPAQYPLSLFNYEWSGDHTTIIGRFLDNQDHTINTIYFSGIFLRQFGKHTVITH